MSRRMLLPLCGLCVVVGACATSPPRTSPPSAAVYITGYEVPRPAVVPCDDELGQREFLRYYHAAYLESMWQGWPWHSTIHPRSERYDAAVAGHQAEQDDAHRDKAEYWAKRGRCYSSALGLLSAEWNPERAERLEAIADPPAEAGDGR